MIRLCQPSDRGAIFAIINDAARAYRGVIPADRWHEPYMSKEELDREIAAGVAFLGCELDQILVGVMGTQPVKDVMLIRHAYVKTAERRRGAGSALLNATRDNTKRPILIGTWAAATWAIRFYEKHGFRLIEGREKTRLLKTYWTVPDRQIETSVVLADATWLSRAAATTSA